MFLWKLKLLLHSHVLLLLAGTYFFVNYITVCHSNVQKVLENSNLPFLSFAVDWIGTQHLIRCVHSSHVFVVFQNYCGSGDRDSLMLLIICPLPAQHCVPTVHTLCPDCTKSGCWYTWRLLWCPSTSGMKGYLLGRLGDLLSKVFSWVDGIPTLPCLYVPQAPNPCWPKCRRGGDLCRRFHSRCCSQNPGSLCWPVMPETDMNW